MTKTVRFSFDSEAQKEEFRAYAANRGMTLSQFAKWACFTVRNKNRKGAPHRPGALLRPAI